MRSNVDLPHPDGPTTVTNSPGETSKDTSSRAWVPSGKTIERFRNDRRAARPPGDAPRPAVVSAVSPAVKP